MLATAVTHEPAHGLSDEGQSYSGRSDATSLRRVCCVHE